MLLSRHAVVCSRVLCCNQTVLKRPHFRTLDVFEESGRTQATEFLSIVPE